jgi:hypothetical protein
LGAVRLIDAAIVLQYICNNFGHRTFHVITYILVGANFWGLEVVELKSRRVINYFAPHLPWGRIRWKWPKSANLKIFHTVHPMLYQWPWFSRRSTHIWSVHFVKTRPQVIMYFT